MAFASTVRERIQQYRPTLERILFGLSLVGILVVVHLFIQQNREFEQGCFGFSTLEAAESAFNCAAVTTSSASHLLGVSNITWGLGFYLAVAVLTVLVFWVQPAVRTWVQGSRMGLLTGGFIYSAYLVYLQANQIEAFCALCLISALVVTLLFGTQLALFVPSSSSTETPMPSRLLKRQVAIFAYLAATALLVIGADVSYFDGLDGTSGQEARATASSSSPAQCSLDGSKTPVGKKGRSLVSFQDITKGSGESDVTIIEYFDPNCPHCKDFHQTMKKLVEAYREEVQFVFKPFPLRGSSLPEIQALYVAAQSGKFTQMLEAQYARQGRMGINMSDLRAIASEIGMDPDVLSNRIEQNKYRNFVLKSRKQAVNIGVDSTPTVLVNGHFVDSRSLKCMKSFIEQAKSGTLASSASR